MMFSLCWVCKDVTLWQGKEYLDEILNITYTSYRSTIPPFLHPPFQTHTHTQSSYTHTPHIPHVHKLHWTHPSHIPHRHTHTHIYPSHTLHIPHMYTPCTFLTHTHPSLIQITHLSKLLKHTHHSHTNHTHISPYTSHTPTTHFTHTSHITHTYLITHLSHTYISHTWCQVSALALLPWPHNWEEKPNF